MDHALVCNLLKKYKETIPFDIDVIYMNYCNCDIEALKYVSNLYKHDKLINKRNAHKILTRIVFKYDDTNNRYDDDYIPNRANYALLSDKLTYFVGFF